HRRCAQKTPLAAGLARQAVVQVERLPVVPLAAGAGAARGVRVAAADPRAGQPLILRRHQEAAGVAALPACDLVRRAALLAAPLPLRRPVAVGLDRPPLVAIPVQRLAGAVALHAHRHGGERRGAQFRRAPRLAGAGTDTVNEVLPQVGRTGVLAHAAADPADVAAAPAALRRAVGDVLLANL